MSFLDDLQTDLADKPWPPGTTTKTKNRYRWKVVGLMAALCAGASAVGWWILALVPAAVAVRKVTIILTDK